MKLAQGGVSKGFPFFHLTVFVNLMISDLMNKKNRLFLNPGRLAGWGAASGVLAPLLSVHGPGGELNMPSIWAYIQ